MRSAWLLPVAPFVVLVSAGAVWAVTLPSLQPVVLPRDHGAHPAFQVEWWYTAGTIAGARGEDYFWFATMWSGEGFVVAKVNLVDLRSDRIVLSKEYLGVGALAPVRRGSTWAASRSAGGRTEHGDGGRSTRRCPAPARCGSR